MYCASIMLKHNYFMAMTSGMLCQNAHIICVIREWSEIMDIYNTQNTLVRDRRTT